MASGSGALAAHCTSRLALAASGVVHGPRPAGRSLRHRCHRRRWPAALAAGPVGTGPGPMAPGPPARALASASSDARECTQSALKTLRRSLRVLSLRVFPPTRNSQIRKTCKLLRGPGRRIWPRSKHCGAVYVSGSLRVFIQRSLRVFIRPAGPTTGQRKQGSRPQPPTADGSVGGRIQWGVACAYCL